MALITTCPSCNASFYVTPEQLAAHRGDVRCGKCAHVFNALHALNQLEAESTSITETSTLAPAQQTLIEETETLVESSLLNEEPLSAQLSTPDTDQSSADDASSLGTSSDSTPDLSSNAESEEHEQPIQPLPAATIDPLPSSSTFVMTRPDFSSDDPLGTRPFNPADYSVESSAEEAPQTNVEPTPVKTVIPAFKFNDVRTPSVLDTLAEPSFLENGPQAKSSWLKTSLLALLALGLLLTACGQALYHYRTELNARYPVIAPYLALACQHLGCSIPLPKHIQFMVVDDSDIQEDPDHKGVIHLSTSLVNTSPYSETYPILELTLTDEYDKPKLRRAFTPQEYLSPETNVKMGMPAGAELSIKLALATDGAPVSGYRVLVRY